jgi:SAM-dependent methyltransferase
MRSFKHWTLRYVLRRCAGIATRLIHPGWPWLTPKAVRFLEAWLKPTDLVFEWGAGRSTLWIARRVRQVTSIEHNPAWFAKVKEQARRQNLRNIDLKLCTNEDGPPAESHYAMVIQEVHGDFDLIIVDGVPERRDQCALAAIQNLKPGGILLIDNANWYLPSSSSAPSSRSQESGPASPEWALFARRVFGWHNIWTTNGLWDTSMWIRPRESTLWLASLRHHGL